ncbi:hypothetical protein B296_00053742 [Ensete ventricosum]|uniref:Uncharacterized protein n=1 Tax=Ensete ventricosum TaxID=4639 RepID=A0A426XVS7_ENSVE|nr:hypothetical protein B296_00053742 [Ensete ventricosum]
MGRVSDLIRRMQRRPQRGFASPFPWETSRSDSEEWDKSRRKKRVGEREEEAYGCQVRDWDIVQFVHQGKRQSDELTASRRVGLSPTSLCSPNSALTESNNDASTHASTHRHEASVLLDGEALRLSSLRLSQMVSSSSSSHRVFLGCLLDRARSASAKAITEIISSSHSLGVPCDHPIQSDKNPNPTLSWRPL